MKTKLKIVATSDLHGTLPKDMPDGDILCIAGDIVPLEYQSDALKSVAWFIQDFTPWTDSLPYKKVLLVPGNHDFMFQDFRLGEKYSGAELMKRIFLQHKGEHKIVLLCDSSFEYEGRRFYGTPWIPDLTGWAFYADHDKLVMKFDNLPRRCDVVISHAPARVGYQGTVMQQGWNFSRDFGCQELADAVKDRQVGWVISGHVHSGNHNVETIDGTHFVNVSLKDENYRPTYEPFTFEI